MFLRHFPEHLETVCWLVTSQQPFMVMASKQRMTSTDDVERCVWLSCFVWDSHFLCSIPLNQLKNPAHYADDTELDIELLGCSLLPPLLYNPDIATLNFRLFPDLKKGFRVQRFETS